MVSAPPQKHRKHWARSAEKRIAQGHVPREYHTAEPEHASAEDMVVRRATAQPNVVTTAQERRDQYVDRFIHPWAYGVCLRITTLRESRCFNDKVDLLTARAECNPYMEDELERLAREDEIELPEDPREHYHAALSEWGRARHLRKIARLTGTYPMETGDMTTGEVYSWLLELHDAVASYKSATAQ